MNSVIMFRNKTSVDFDYLRLGDVFRSKQKRKLKVFIKGEIAKYIYVKKYDIYRIILRVLYYDLKENRFEEEYIRYHSDKLNGLEFEIVGVYRKIK